MRDAVGQFVAVVRQTRKMRGQQFARLADAVEDALREFGFLEIAGHLARHGLPEFIAATIVNTFIADDRKLPGLWRDKDQDAVPVVGFGHAQSHKRRLRRRNRILDFLVADKNADFAGGLLLGFADGRDYVVMS